MKKKVIAIIIALLVGAVGLFLWQTKVFAPKTAKEEVKQEEKSGPVRSELTGLETTADKAKRPITAVMVENSPEARPQSGLKDAGVVFEAVAEGGITRFVALYQEAQPDLIGPVRSIRPYFVEWAAGFDAGLAHVGGSELALNMVKSGDYVADLDQFKAPEGIFWRSEDRVAPHNMYTKMSGLDKYMAKLDKKKSDFQSWDRQALNSDKTESDLPAAQAIRLPVSTGIFEVSYHYDTASKTYQRFQGGEAHQDREKGQISPDVVIAIMVNQKLSADGNHMDIETTGTGKVYIFQNGKVQEGNWAKSNAQTNISFTDGQGNKIPLKSGQTWITAVDNSREVIWE
ncbi:DUF3048 domain-containing protein [Lactococcus formosensis]|uniref:DUF3048 domain-containing protein n=1 Tax=Lactococcus formosensis TaxID=1281486 RepID=UPI0013FDA182|nr:DUF3048 domain-containing protein [Lactococcus formosensis]NHI67655.1 DUF3048 domain-containing protein [Lactococcus garvieae]